MEDEVEIVLDDWDPEDLGNSVRRLNEVRNVQSSITQIRDALEQHVIDMLKKRGWDKFLDEESKVNVRIVQKKRQSIDKEKLKIQLPKSKIAEIVKITDIEELEIMSPELRDKIKDEMKKKKTEKPHRHGAK